MKTNNPIIDSMLEAQANVLNNWMESTKKMQSSFQMAAFLTKDKTF